MPNRAISIPMTKRKALIFALLFAAVAGICATDTDKKVYITDTGKKYHCKDCKTLKKSTTSMRSVEVVVLIRWLQSALIPFITTQSVGVLKPPHESKHLTELTVKDAQAKGYTACKVCKPPEK